MNALGNCPRCGERRPCDCPPMPADDVRAVAIQGSAAETVAACERARGYVSPHGKPAGLQARLLEWAERMATDRTLPWAGLGIIGDLKLAAAILNLREFAEHLRVNGDATQREFADEILRNDETVEALGDAMDRAGLVNFDPVAGVETLTRERDAAVRTTRAVRDVLAGMGVVDDLTPDDALPGLLRALLS